MKKHENCTMYTSGEFMGNYQAYKCKWVEIEIAPYAQYSRAIHVRFLEKGKRNPRSFVQTYKPSLVIAQGWNAPAPANPFVTVSETAALTVQTTKYRSFDEGWKNDFTTQVLPNLTVLADFHGHNCYDKFSDHPYK